MNNLFLGTGYTYLFWQDGRATSARGEEFARARDAAGEVPIYFMIFGFGLVGSFLILLLYIITAQIFFKIIKLLRLTLFKYLDDPFTIIYAAFVLLIIASKFTIKIYNLSQDFDTYYMGHTAIIMGIGFAIYRKLQMNLLKDSNFVSS